MVDFSFFSLLMTVPTTFIVASAFSRILALSSARVAAFELPSPDVVALFRVSSSCS